MLTSTNLLMQVNERLEGGRGGAVGRRARAEPVAERHRELLGDGVHVAVQRVAGAHRRRDGGQTLWVKID